jgi:hypothetical protein
MLLQEHRKCPELRQMEKKQKAVLATVLLACVAGAALANATGGFDPKQLPETKGKVLEYSLTPRGDVDGVILADGTEVHLPPHLGTQLVFAVKPGDAVSIRGLKARAVAMIQAISITNDANGNEVVDQGMGGPPVPSGAAETVTAAGKVKEQLHGPRGDLNGVLLEDGTIVRLPPPEAARLSDMLTPGGTLHVQGDGYDGKLGRVVAANTIGSDASKMVQVAQPPARPGPPPPGGPDAPLLPPAP